MNIEADANNQIGQAQNQKKADQMSAQNQLLAIKNGLPDDPSASMVGNLVGAALGVGDSFMKYTTPDKTAFFGRSFG
jgi:hypothetical protein